MVQGLCDGASFAYGSVLAILIHLDDGLIFKTDPSMLERARCDRRAPNIPTYRGYKSPRFRTDHFQPFRMASKLQPDFAAFAAASTWKR